MSLIEFLHSLQVAGPIAFLAGVPFGYYARHVQVDQEHRHE